MRITLSNGGNMTKTKPQWEVKLDKILENGINTDKLNNNIKSKLKELYDIDCSISEIETDNGHLFSFKGTNDFEIILDYEKLNVDNADNPTRLDWILTIIDTDNCIFSVDQDMRILFEVEKVALFNDFDLINLITNLSLPTVHSLNNNGYSLVKKLNENDDVLSCVFYKYVKN